MKTLLTLISAILFCSTASASASSKGGSGAHGGTVVVCGDKVELVDLYEIRLNPKLNALYRVVYQDTPVHEQIDFALWQLENPGSDIYLRVAKFVGRFLKLHTPNLKEEDGFSGDVESLPPLPEGCVLKNVVHYHNDNDIRVNRRLFDRLSPTDQAALAMHEGIYRVFRESFPAMAWDTIVVRRLTALLFMNDGAPGFVRQMMEFYLLPKEERGISFDLGRGVSLENCVLDVIDPQPNQLAKIAKIRLQRFASVVEPHRHKDGTLVLPLERVHYYAQDPKLALQLELHPDAPAEPLWINLRLRCGQRKKDRFMRIGSAWFNFKASSTRVVSAPINFYKVSEVKEFLDF